MGCATSKTQFQINKISEPIPVQSLMYMMDRGVEPKKQQKEDSTVYIKYADIKEIKKIKKQGLRVYWIDSRIHEGQNIDNSAQFRKQFPNLNPCSNFNILLLQIQNDKKQIVDKNQKCILIASADFAHVEDYKKILRSCPIISHVILFCLVSEGAQLIINLHQKISGYGLSVITVTQLVKKYGQKLQNSQKKTQNVLLMINDQISLIYKYLMNYYLITEKQQDLKSNNKFRQFLTVLHIDKINVIEDYFEKVSLQLTQQAKRKYLLAEVFQKNFIWNAITEFQKLTTDPFKLAYIQNPTKDLYYQISSQFKANTNRHQLLYIVAELTLQQIKNIGQNCQSFMIFPSFVKGFTSQKYAKSRFNKLEIEGKRVFLFTVIYDTSPKNNLNTGYAFRKDQCNQLDYGNVIFNLNNFFKIDSFSVSEKKGTLQNASLFKVMNQLGENPSYFNDLSASMQMMVRHLNNLENKLKKIKNQGSFLAIHGKQEQTLEYFDQKITFLVQNHQPQTSVDKILLQKGDYLQSKEKYSQAQEQYSLIKTEKLSIVAKLRLIEIRFKMQKYEIPNNLIEQAFDKVGQLKNGQFMQEYFIGKNIHGFSLILKKEFKKANSFYSELQKELRDFYAQNLQKLSLVHSIYKIMALKDVKQEDYPSALQILIIIQKWQYRNSTDEKQIFQIETMIKQVKSLINGDNVPKVSNKIPQTVPQTQIQEPIVEEYDQSYWQNYHQRIRSIKQSDIRINITFSC